MSNEKPLNFHKYEDRRRFTDDAHKRWMKPIYDRFHWTEIPFPEGTEQALINDLKHGQDYYVKTNTGQQLSIQERNRTGEKALQYNDITIRYQYPEYSENYQASEWFKIDADIMIYTVVGKQPTYLSDLDQYDSYDKVAVINMRLFEKYVKSKKIQLIPSSIEKTSYMTKSPKGAKILVSPVRHNVGHINDSPSSFIVFDVKHLYELDPNLIGYDKGFGTPVDELKT